MSFVSVSFLVLSVIRDIVVRCGGVHPNLLRVHGWLMPEPDVLHIVMERAETDLLTALRRRLALKKRMKIAIDVARGLIALHGASYVYQDLKPETVLVSLRTFRSYY